jgi:class 3 adenylate cyclase
MRVVARRETFDSTTPHESRSPTMPEATPEPPRPEAASSRERAHRRRGLEEEPDIELVQQAGRAENTPRRELDRHYDRSVSSIAGRMEWVNAATEDIFQRIWRLLVRSFGRVRRLTRLAGWSASTARREAIPQLSRQIPAPIELQRANPSLQPSSPSSERTVIHTARRPRRGPSASDQTPSRHNQLRRYNVITTSLGSPRGAHQHHTRVAAACPSDEVQHQPESNTGLSMFAAVLFTDIVESTALEARMGDRAWRRRLEEHDLLAQMLISAAGGRIAKHTGDGVLATFPDPTSAVTAAYDLSAELAAIGLPLRAGLHAGVIEARGSGDVLGITVNIAARVQARAEPGEILVSDTLRDILLGTALTFDDRGEYQLKGLDRSRRLYAITSSVR